MAEKKGGLAVVTGASSGIGLAIAKECADHGFDLVVAADEPAIHDAADELRRRGVSVEAVEADLATDAGVDKLYAAAKSTGRPVDALIANAGSSMVGGFLDQEFESVRRTVDTNVSGTLRLIHHVGRDMRAAGGGRILIVGSIAGFTPGAFSATYNATKAFIDSFSFAIREELKDTGVTVTCLMPGATETEFFERAGLEDTAAGQAKKDDAGMVARVGFKAMMDGDGDVVSGWKNKVVSALANITPAATLAAASRKMFEPGSGKSD